MHIYVLKVVKPYSLHTGVLRGLNFVVRSRPVPAKFKPAPHPYEFEKSCPLPLRTRPADHPNPRPLRTFSVSNPHLPENY